MSKRAQLPDGTILEFPDETPDAVMDRAVKSHLSGGSRPARATPQPSFGQRAGRELGLGLRAGLQGIGGTLGIVTDPIAYGADKLLNAVAPPQKTLSGLVTGEQPQDRRFFGTAREGFASLADRLHLPTPQTGSERIGGGITEALAGGGGLMSLGKSLATRAPGVVQAVGETLASRPATQVASIVGGSGAAGATREAGGGPGVQTLAALVGGLAPGATSFGGAGALRRLVRGGEAGRANMQQGINDFRAVGAQPSVGQAVGNRRTQGLESLLAGNPTASGRMASFAERQAENIGSGLQKRADQFLPNASAERAGRAVEDGVGIFAGNVKATRRALYWQADKLIPDTVTLPLHRTQMTLAELTTPHQGAMATTGALVNPKIAQMAQNVSDDLAANGGAMPYEAVRALRSRIGEELSDFSLSADRPTAQYKRLYASLSQDLEEAARQQGPAAEQAAKRANNYTRASADRLEQVQRVVDKNGGPEKVFSAVMAGTQDGGTTLRAVMQSLPKDGQRAVTAAVIKRMGLPTPGQAGLGEAQFSAQTFLTNWNRVSPEARRALFDRHGPAFSADMDKIARVAERIRTGSKVFANPSGTANRALAIGYYSSLPAAGVAGAMGAGPLPLAGLVLSGIGANSAARAMTNPKFVSWLARTTEMPVSALPQQIVVLKQIGKDDPDVADLAAELERQQPIDQ